MAKSKKQVKIDKKDFILVTEANKKFCLTIGRAFYVWDAGLTCNTPEAARLIFRPRMKKNTYLIENGVETHIRFDEDREEYAAFYITMVDKYIKQKKVFINPSEPLMKIEVQDKNGDPIEKSKVEVKEEIVEIKAKQTNPFNI